MKRHPNLIFVFITVLTIFLSTSCSVDSFRDDSVYDSKIISGEISNSCITCFAEDKEGYVWIGTERGLNKYTGTEYIQYFHSSSGGTIKSNKITSLLVDSQGTLWVGTSTGINSMCRDESFKDYTLASGSKLIGGIYEYDGDIYTTTLGTLLKLNRETDEFEVVMTDNSTSEIACCSFSADIADVAMSSYVITYDMDSDEIIRQTYLDGTIKDAFYDNDRFIYLATDTGLIIFDSKRHIVENKPVDGVNLEMVSNFDDGQVLFSNGIGLMTFDYGTMTTGFPIPQGSEYEISDCMLDSKGNIWIGYSNNGFSVIYKYERDFYSIGGSLKSNLAGKNVTSIAKDSSGRVFVAVDHNELYVYENEQFRQIDLGKTFNTKITKQQNLVNIFSAGNGDILLCINFVIARCGYNDGTLHLKSTTKMWDSTPGLGNLSVNDFVIYSTLVTSGPDNDIWAGSVDGTFHHFNKTLEDLGTVPISNRNLTHMGAMVSLANGNIAGGFYGRDIQIRDPVNCTVVRTVPLTSLAGESFFMTALCEDKDGGLWAGLRSEGVFHVFPDLNTVEKIEGIVCNDICSILCDNHGDIWISTYDGLSRYEKKSGQITNYLKEDGIGGNQFNYMASAILDDGRLLFGGTHGITIIDPELNDFRCKSLPFQFENLYINNKLVIPFLSDNIESRLCDVSKVLLKAQDRQVSISFSAIDYGQSNHIRYSYALDNTTEDAWVSTNTVNTVTFSKFPYGQHTLYVRIESPDNPYIDQTVSLNIQAHRPVMLSVVALIIYILIAISVGLFIIILFNRLYRADLQQESQQRTNEMNMRFFANISHEFRTPLTMVNGAIKQLKGHNLEGDERNRLYSIINRNADRMINLVNQIMDFGKMESDVLELKVAKLDVLVIINRIIEEYKFAATQHRNVIKLRTGVDMLPMWLDEDKFEKIMYNLLSNAVKFTTSEGGVIAVDADIVTKSEAERYFVMREDDVDDKYLFVSIFNSGSFIPEEKLETVFERYAQLDDGARVGGTGIGLYFAKRLVDIHHGHIKAANKHNDSNPDRSGVVFTFILPVNDISYPEAERLIEEVHPAIISKTVVNNSQTEIYQSDDSKPTLLAIDDDYEIIYYLKTLLTPDFKVYEALNAEEGLKAVGQINPDIILCDILMPGADGFSLCSQIKHDMSICHIPVVLLTAKYDIEDQIKGLNCGANAYVMKPFDPDYLVALLRSQLNNRDKIREMLKHSTGVGNVENTITDELDKKFISSLYTLMEQCISNPDMDVTEMAKALNVSRSQLFYKVKALTGETPHAFFNHYKLNIAAQWILEDRYKISAIAQDLGFVSASHFTSIFKKEFGCLPSDYKRLHRD